VGLANELRDIIWMRQQWRSFRRLLIGAISAVWVMCTSGLLILRAADPEAEQWFYARLALLTMLGASTLVTVWLFAKANLEISQLGRDATDLRFAQIRKDREEKGQQRPRRPPAS
jgi:hypothetical protein